MPIVFLVAEDPVRLGLVASLAHPGDNLTGVNFLGGELVAKQLELRRELVSLATRVAGLVNPANLTSRCRLAHPHSREGHAPRFAGNGLRVVYAGWDDFNVVQPDGGGQARKGGGGGGPYPQAGRAMTALQNWTPLRPPWFSPAWCRSRASNHEFSPSFLTPVMLAKSPEDLFLLSWRYRF